MTVRRVTLAVLVTVLVVAGCGGGGEPDVERSPADDAPGGQGVYALDVSGLRVTVDLRGARDDVADRAGDLSRAVGDANTTFIPVTVVSTGGETVDVDSVEITTPAGRVVTAAPGLDVLRALQTRVDAYDTATFGEISALIDDLEAVPSAGEPDERLFAIDGPLPTIAEVRVTGDFGRRRLTRQ